MEELRPVFLSLSPSLPLSLVGTRSCVLPEFEVLSEIKTKRKEKKRKRISPFHSFFSSVSSETFGG